MEAAAVRLAKAVKYANAGTVEYLFLGKGLAQVRAGRMMKPLPPSFEALAR